MANTRKPRNGAELLKKIQPRLAEETTRICLRPDLIEEYNTAHAELDEHRAELERLGKQASASKGGRMASRLSPAEQQASEKQQAAAKRVQAVEKKMDDAAVDFTFRAMAKDKWRDLVDANPPREGNQIDLFSGYNRDAVHSEAVRPSLIDPEWDDCEDKDCEHDDCGTWQHLVRLLNSGQWDRLRNAAELVNTGVADVPKSQTASDILARAASASKQPEAGESPPAASRGGSRRRSTTTTTPTEPS